MSRLVECVPNFSEGRRREVVEELLQVVAGVPLPLNVLVRAGLPRVSELAALGVRRISAGSGIASAVHGLTRRGVRQFLDTGTYDAMLDGAVPYAELNALFGERP